MNVILDKPCGVSDKGNRPNNEDCIFPHSENIDSNQRLFLVCDGVGGAEKGEIASSIACESFHTFFSSFIEGEPTVDLINKAVKYTETRFDEYSQVHKEAKGMATTLAMLHFGKLGATIAHIGDSRVYQIRNGKIVYQTEDHSLVNSLIKLGKVNPEESYNHPQKNVITRAILGSSSSVEAEIVQISDIKSGDFFFMCTDGVTESYTNNMLADLFATKQHPDFIKNSIVEKCSQKSRDNFSFYIIPVQSIESSSSYKQLILSFFYSFV